MAARSYSAKLASIWKYAYSLYEGSAGRRVARFGHSRLMLQVDAEQMSSMVGAL